MRDDDEYLDKIFVDVLNDFCWNVGLEPEVVIELQEAVHVALG